MVSKDIERLGIDIQHSIDSMPLITDNATMASYVESQIAERRRALADLERRRLVLEAELRTFEDVFRHQLAEKSAEHDANDWGNGATHDAPERTILTAFERMSPEWQNVVRTLRLRQTFRANDMFDVGASQGMMLTLPNVRSQLTLLTQRGILRRLAEGEYAVAEEIAAAE